MAPMGKIRQCFKLS